MPRETCFRLNQTEPTTFSILPCLAFFRDAVFIYFGFTNEGGTPARTSIMAFTSFLKNSETKNNLNKFKCHSI
jgi:hypothetical protein